MITLIIFAVLAGICIKLLLAMIGIMVSIGLIFAVLITLYLILRTFL